MWLDSNARKRIARSWRSSNDTWRRKSVRPSRSSSAMWSPLTSFAFATAANHASVPARLALDRFGGIADLVVVVDRVLGLLVLVGVVEAVAELEQRRVEELLLRLRVRVQQGPQPLPDDGEHVRVVGADVLERGEEPSLLGVVVEDHLRDVHVRSFDPLPGERRPAAIPIQSPEPGRFLRFGRGLVRMLEPRGRMARDPRMRAVRSRRSRSASPRWPSRRSGGVATSGPRGAASRARSGNSPGVGRVFRRAQGHRCALSIADCSDVR